MVTDPQTRPHTDRTDNSTVRRYNLSVQCKNSLILITLSSNINFNIFKTFTRAIFFLYTRQNNKRAAVCIYRPTVNAVTYNSLSHSLTHFHEPNPAVFRMHHLCRDDVTMRAAIVQRRRISDDQESGAA